MNTAADLRAPGGAIAPLRWRNGAQVEPAELGYPRAAVPANAPAPLRRIALPHDVDVAAAAAALAVFALRACGAPSAHIAIHDGGWRALEITVCGALTAAELTAQARTLLAASAPRTADAPACAIALSAGGADHPGSDHLDMWVALRPRERCADIVLHRDFAAVADSIAAHIEAAFAAFAGQPPQRLDQLRFSPPLERALIDEYASGPKKEVAFVALPDAIAAQARASGARTALLGAGVALSFTELQARIDARASALTRLGAGRGAIIGVCLSRNPDLIVTLLAVLRTGAAYLPLDPAHPTVRIEDMIADAEAAFVIVDAATSARHRLTGAASRDLAEIDAMPSASWQAPSLAADDLAYVIYTSGSTGKPKGVAVAHATLAVFFAGMDATLTAQPDDRWLTVTAPTFDPSVLDYFWTLARGSSVAVYCPNDPAHGPSVAEAVVLHRATHLQCTPSVIAMMLVDPHGPAAFAQLRVVLVGGEAMSRTGADAVQALMGSQGRLINLYGPTEATVWSTLGDIPRDGGLIHLGRPIANVGVHVLAPDGAVQAALAPGEIWIEGPNIALGYWRRPELTAPAFVESAAPFMTRMYRTGDIARRWPDGRLEYLGRRDDQVKIRGHRIELGEIERVLERVAGVQRLIVVARALGDDPADRRLIAYYTERPGARVDPVALRAAAVQRLPDYMRPHAAIRLDAFELTATGKIDRKKLPAPPAQTEDHSGDDGDPIAAQLRTIWRVVLGFDGGRADQSFFDLGGTSVTGARLLARIDEAFGVRLPLASLFDAPTIAAQAALLAQRGAGAAFSPLVTIQAGAPARRAFFCVHGAGGNVVFLQPLAAELGAHRPLVGIQAYGVDGQSEPLSDIPTIAARYVAAIRHAQPNGPYLLGGYSGGGAIAIEMAQQLRAADQAVALVALFDALAPGSRVTGFSLAERLAHLPHVNPAIIWNFIVRRLTPFAAKQAATTPLERAAEKTLAAMLNGLDSYRPPAYDGPVLLVRAAQARLSYVVAGALLGWGQTLRGSVDALSVNATHDDMFEGAALKTLGSHLRRRLDDIDPPSGEPAA